MQVSGVGADMAWLSAAAKSLDASVALPSQDSPLASSTEPMILLLNDTTASALKTALTMPIRYCYALDPRFDVTAIQPPHAALRHPDVVLGLCISVGTANDLPIASLLSDAVRARLDLSDVQGMNLEIALGEAIANSLIHGCLGLDSPPSRFEPDFIDAIEARASDPRYASRPIWIGFRQNPVTDNGDLHVVVASDGAGFAPPPQSAFLTPERACRGLGLIYAASQSVAFEDHGRCLKMKFSR